MFGRLKTAWVWILKEFSGSCHEVTQSLSRCMDDPHPSLLTRLRLRVHFLICDYCKRYAEQLKFLRQAVRKYPESPSASSAPAPTPSNSSPQNTSDESAWRKDAMERLKERLKNSGS